jgi:hypothetical protein
VKAGTLPIPHLQWFREDEPERQVRLLKERGFHTVIINLQTAREKWVWERILRGMEMVKRQYPEVRPIFTGVSSLKTMARLRQTFPQCCFCNSVCQYLAQRHVRLRREGMREEQTPATRQEFVFQTIRTQQLALP